MAVTLLSRPQGYVLDTTSNTATASSSAGTAQFAKTGHGLSTNDIIYIYSIYTAYNGYWKVVKIDNNNFQILALDQSTNQVYVNSGTVTYYKSVLTHGWCSVHLPIVYTLSSGFWPVNHIDPSATISSQANYGGYTAISLSGDISTGTTYAYDSIIISGSNVDGVYKIIKYISETSFVIDLLYSTSNTVTGSTVNFYYFNYSVNVRVYAGISASHFWTGQKPYELIVELKLIPDSTGHIKVNIADYIKAKIDVVSNNTLLDTLPNNINAWCNFYITYGDSYDDSNGYVVTRHTSSYTDDSGTFEGYACNAILPFKTQSSGHLSKYVSGVTSATRQKWLTSFTRPTLFSGKYFDISYIKNTSASGDYIKVDRYNYDGTNYTLASSTLDVITDNDQGIYRYSLSQTGSEKRIDLTYYNSSNVQLSETITIDVYDGCSNQDFYLVWLNYLGGYDYWNFTARKTYETNIVESKTQDTNINNNWPSSYGEFADSITKQTLKTGKNNVGVNSQFLTTDQQDSIKLLFNSPLVQICTSQYDRRTVIADGKTLMIRRDQDKTRKLSFNVIYTDNLPSQSI